MSQISPPIRILVVLAIAVTGVYMLFMRPKTDVVPPAEPAPNVQTTAPAVSEPGKIAESAQEAVEASNGQLSAQESVDGVDSDESAAGTVKSRSRAETAKPMTGNAAAAAIEEDLKGLPKPVARALRQNKVLVLLFWNPKAADDKAVRAALKDVDRWNGRVSVQVAPIRQIAKYGRISRGVDVEQSPTIVITDSELKAETLVGYVDTTTIDQVVVDAFRNSSGLFTSAYLREINGVCVRHSNAVAAVPGYYTGGNVKKSDARIAAYDKAVGNFVADFKAVKAPKRWRAYDAAAVADLTVVAASISNLSAAVTPKSSGASLRAADRSYRAAAKPAGTRMSRRFDSKGLFRCGSQF